MPISWDFGIGSAIGGIAGTIGNIINTKQTNEANLKIARETNEANRQMVEMQNKAAAQEAEKAYNRSKAGNQVSLMQSAGMSRAGAINALNGGGSYSPAPVNVSQDTAPTMQTTDFSNLAQIGAAIRSQSSKDNVLKSIFDKISERGDWFNTTDYMPTLDDVYSVLNDRQRKAMTDPAIRQQVQEYIDGSFKHREDNHNLHMFTYAEHAAEYERDMRNLERDLRNAVQDGRISAEQKQNAANESKAILEKLSADTSYEALMDMPKDLRQKYFETRALLEWLSHAGEMSAEKVINKLRTLLGL